jgi:hypothetical protein
MGSQPQNKSESKDSICSNAEVHPFTVSTEADFLSAFIIKHRRERYLGYLGSKKRRAKLQKAWPHFGDFDPRYIVQMQSHLHFPASIADELRRRGAGKLCYVMSEDSSLDGQILELDRALERIVGYFNGTVLICQPAHLAFYEGEVRDRYILHRRD